MRVRAIFALLLACACSAAFAHRAPNSLVKLEFRDRTVNAELLVPESELAFATAAEPDSGSLTAYLLRHVKLETATGLPWKVEVRSMRKTQYLEHDYLSVGLALTPPAGASIRSFVLVDDAVTHEVRNHVILVLANSATKPELLGMLQYPERRMEIARPPATQK